MFLFWNYLGSCPCFKNRVTPNETLKKKKKKSGTRVHGARVPFKELEFHELEFQISFLSFFFFFKFDRPILDFLQIEFQNKDMDLNSFKTGTYY